MMICRNCRRHLVGYLEGELNKPLRQQVARHLGRCEACYTLYLQYRETNAELRQMLPRLGMPQPAALDRVWRDVQAELAPSHSGRHFRARYGVVVLLAAMVFVVPLTMGNRSLPFDNPPTPPVPVTRVAPSQTASVSATEAATAFRTVESQATPEAIHETIGAPLPPNTPPRL
jgi:anti-sigma factor RsiW